MFEHFDDPARKIVVRATNEARRLNVIYVGTESILLGCLTVEQSVAAQALLYMGVTLEAAREAASEVLAEAGAHLGSPSGHMPFTVQANTVIETSYREAFRLGSNTIRPEHLLLSLIRHGEISTAARVLERLGFDPTEVREQVLYDVRVAAGMYLASHKPRINPARHWGLTGLNTIQVMHALGLILESGQGMLALELASQLLSESEQDLVGRERTRQFVDRVLADMLKRLKVPYLDTDTCIRYALDLQRLFKVLAVAGTLQDESPVLYEASRAFVQECVRICVQVPAESV